MDNTALHKVSRRQAGKRDYQEPQQFSVGEPIREVLLATNCKTSKELSRNKEGILR